MKRYNVALVGKGAFGSKIYSKLTSNKSITTTYLKGTSYKTGRNFDWVFIATPTDTHFKIAKYFIEKGSNVFVEKPCTSTFEETEELISLASYHGVRIYIDDIFLYNPTVDKLVGQDITSFEWLKYGSFKDNIYNALAYHDIYTCLALEQIKYDDPIELFENQNNLKRFKINNIEFKYNRLSQETRKSVVTKTGKLVYDVETDSLTNMINSVLELEVDFEYNNDLALQTQSILDRISSVKPKVAIAGGGIFGTTAALILSENGYEVDLYEKHNTLFKCASGINQYRLHRGYHYPRSKETALSSKEGTDTFLERFPCIKDSSQFYAVARHKSKVSSSGFENFMDSIGLNYQLQKKINYINYRKIENIYSVDERIYDPSLLQKIVLDQIEKSNINLKIGSEYKSKYDVYYDYIINATYSEINLLRQNKQELQFELCEKPIVKLPKHFKGRGIVVVDGPFTCIDPFMEDYHVVGNVVHAIHDSYVGTNYKPPRKFRKLINNGIITKPKITNIDKFKESLKEFFLNVEPIEHIGSMFTVRTVLPNRDHDDARPSLVTKEDVKNYSIFSGKVSTAVDVSNELLNTLLTT